MKTFTSRKDVCSATCLPGALSEIVEANSSACQLAKTARASPQRTPVRKRLLGLMHGQGPGWLGQSSKSLQSSRRCAATVGNASPIWKRSRFSCMMLNDSEFLHSFAGQPPARWQKKAHVLLACSRCLPVPGRFCTQGIASPSDPSASARLLPLSAELVHLARHPHHAAPTRRLEMFWQGMC